MKEYIKSDDFWPSISDLMSSLMIIFMFIAISFMSQISKEKQTLTDIANEYKKVKISIYEELFNEFETDLNDWNAYIDQETLSIKFREPDVFFEQGSSKLNEKFKEILNDFFPRYMAILNSDKYRDEIEEVRIEGHTSTEWTRRSTPMESYFRNMELSQNRTRSTLHYIMSLDSMKKHENFMIEKVTANGLSYSKRIMINGKEDKKLSRRVEFRIRTKAERKLDQILAKANKESDKNEIN
ncbi:OmpA/MotB family protein [Fusobacterium mortiferum]|jgi:outer membrane protein OmpA-like peptidoglycan-associated protein|uniref:OmpA/MotB family protein n=1 Tax=Fusobacterium mortiferum TaxID=850 RepID=UPI0022E798CE|nr:OmpA family protein [Fusobacterium mortiferum]